MRVKNILIIVVFAILIASAGVLRVSAAEEETNTNKSYYINGHYQSSLGSSLEIDTWDYKFELDSKYNIVIYWTNWHPQGYYTLGYLISDGNTIESYMSYEGFKYNNIDKHHPSSNDISFITDYTDIYDFKRNITEYDAFNNIVNSIDSPTHWLYPIYSSKGFKESRYVSTNIPIFDSIEMARDYLLGKVSINEAVNKQDVIKNTYDSADVPVPKNMKVYEENKKYYLTWEQTSEDMQNISAALFRKQMTGGEFEVEIDKVYPGYPRFDTDELSPQLAYKIDITDILLKIKTYFKENEIETYKVGLDLNVRNRWNKSEIDILYSSTVHAVLVVSYSYSDGLQVSVEYEEKDKDGNYINDSVYNDYGDGSGIVDDKFTAIGGMSSSNFLGNIVNGFGLIGNGGIVGILSEAFSYIPAEIWSMFGAGISLFLIIGFFKLLVR